MQELYIKSSANEDNTFNGFHVAVSIKLGEKMATGGSRLPHLPPPSIFYTARNLVPPMPLETRAFCRDSTVRAQDCRHGRSPQERRGLCRGRFQHPCDRRIRWLGCGEPQAGSAQEARRGLGACSSLARCPHSAPPLHSFRPSSLTLFSRPPLLSPPPRPSSRSRPLQSLARLYGISITAYVHRAPLLARALPSLRATSHR